MLNSRKLLKASTLLCLLMSGVATASEIACGGCRTLEDAARVGTGYLWERSSGFSGVLAPIGDWNRVVLTNAQLGLKFTVVVSIEMENRSLGSFGSFVFNRAGSRSFHVLDKYGNFLRKEYTVSQLEQHASLWEVAAHLGFSQAQAAYVEGIGWHTTSPYTELFAYNDGLGLTLDFQRHYNYQPSTIVKITDCATPSCGLSTQSSAQAPGGALIVPVPLEEPKNRER